MLAGRFGLTGEENVAEIHARVREDGWYDDGVRPSDLPWLQLAWAQITLAVQAYDPADYEGRAMVFEDAVDSRTSERRWLRAVKDAWIYRLDHGIESPTALINDAHVAQAMRKALEA
jgi:hypothetical protein